MKSIKYIVLIALLFTVCMVHSQEEKKKKDKSIETVIIKTTSECDMCKERIEKHLAYEKGVKYVNLEVKTKELTVKYRTDKTDIDKIKKAISEVGYDADDVKADPEAYAKLPECCKVGGHSNNGHQH